MSGLLVVPFDAEFLGSVVDRPVQHLVLGEYLTGRLVKVVGAPAGWVFVEHKVRVWKSSEQAAD